MQTARRTFFIDCTEDRRDAAIALATGHVVAHAFGNFYALTARPDVAIVRGVNCLKGRPIDQVGSILTTRSHIDGLFDWDAVPAAFPREDIRALIDELFELGPIGFRGPAAAAIPPHLSSMDGNIRTTQLIGPGYRCPSNALLDEAMDQIGAPYLYVTSANRSRHRTGAADEPAHFEAAALEAEFCGENGFLLIRHRDEPLARARYPLHLPMSTTVIAFHRAGATDRHGRPALILQRHGSLAAETLAQIADRHGFALDTGTSNTRLTSRAA